MLKLLQMGKNTRYSFEVTRDEIVIASTAYSDKN